MPRTIVISIERIRSVILRTPAGPFAPLRDSEPTDQPPKTKEETMKKRILALLACTVLFALPARPQGPPFVAGLNAPTRMVFSTQGNILVAESGQATSNTGRISIIDRATATRRTLIDGLPSGLNLSGGESAPSGPSGIAIANGTIFVSIGAGDASGPGPASAPGSEMANPSPSSPLYASLLSLRSTTSYDLIHGGFTLTVADQTRLKNGETVTLQNASGESLAVKLVADFPDYTSEPRPDFPANVRAGNPFGVAASGSTVYVVDASQNLIRRVDANTGSFSTLTTFSPIANPLPFGPPVVDPVPDSVRLRGSDLLVSMLTGFPFPGGKAEIRRVDTVTGNAQTFITGLSSAIDAAPLGNGASDPVLALEFSTDMLNNLPGRVSIVNADGTRSVIAEGLPTPSGMLVDQRSGEIFVAHIFPGFITRIAAAGAIPALPPASIIPVVAALSGPFGSRFTTSMQIANPYSFAISGRMVVHPQGRAGSPSDPSLAYTLAPFETKRYSDFMTSAGASGGGSVDVIPSVGSAPVTVTSIVNEAADGMPMVLVPQVDPASALTAGSRGSLITPPDATAWRFNIGIRTLANGASLTISVRDAAGKELSSLTRSFPANYFQQFGASELLGTNPPANASVVFTVTSGSAIVYGSGVKNSTGDAILQIAKGVSD
jgi:hypothetical protein